MQKGKHEGLPNTHASSRCLLALRAAEAPHVRTSTGQSRLGTATSARPTRRALRRRQRAAAPDHGEVLLRQRDAPRRRGGRRALGAIVRGQHQRLRGAAEQRGQALRADLRARPARSAARPARGPRPGAWRAAACSLLALLAHPVATSSHRWYGRPAGPAGPLPLLCHWP